MNDIHAGGRARLLWGSDDWPMDDDAVRFRPPEANRRVVADPENVERGLAQLVLTLIDLLRQLMERQALRRVQRGSLTDAEVERLGETFRRLAARMEELKETFGFSDDDLNMHLGPLGDLL